MKREENSGCPATPPGTPRWLAARRTKPTTAGLTWIRMASRAVGRLYHGRGGWVNLCGTPSRPMPDTPDRRWRDLRGSKEVRSRGVLPRVGEIELDTSRRRLLS